MKEVQSCIHSHVEANNTVWYYVLKSDKICTEMYDELKMFTNEIKFVKIYGKSWISCKDAFLTDEAQFHRMCHSHESVN